MKKFFIWLFGIAATLSVAAAGFAYYIDNNVRLPPDIQGIAHFEIDINGLKLGGKLPQEVETNLKPLNVNLISQCGELTKSLPFNQSATWHRTSYKSSLPKAGETILALTKENVIAAICIKGEGASNSDISNIKGILTKHSALTSAIEGNHELFQTTQERVYPRNFKTLYLYLNSIHNELVSEADAERKAFEIQQGYLSVGAGGRYSLMLRDNYFFPHWTLDERETKVTNSYDILDAYELKYGERLSKDQIANSELAMKIYYYLMYHRI